MNQAEQILLAKEYMYQFHKNDYSGHDIAHIAVSYTHLRAHET